MVQKNGAFSWSLSSVEQNTKEKMLNLIKQASPEGMYAAELSKVLSISKAMVSRYKKELIEEGLIKNTPRNSPLVAQN